jgi:hypothetical protein
VVDPHPVRCRLPRLGRDRCRHAPTVVPGPASWWETVGGADQSNGRRTIFSRAQPEQGRGVGTHLLGTVAHRLVADGSRSMCVGYDSGSPYKRFYMKYGAVETEAGSPWAIWHDVAALAALLPRPGEALLRGLHERRGSWLRRLWHGS